MIPVILDVTKQEDIDRVLSRIDAEVGQLDGLVNNAGGGRRRSGVVDRR
ncbi:MAG: SDR family NAD(P)-dependent oxidoreductase [Acidimicrobiales bacterium]